MVEVENTDSDYYLYYYYYYYYDLQSLIRPLCESDLFLPVIITVIGEGVIGCVSDNSPLP